MKSHVSCFPALLLLGQPRRSRLRPDLDLGGDPDRPFRAVLGGSSASSMTISPQYGNWIERPNYGWGVDPARRLPANWRPYEDGALGLDRSGVDLGHRRALRLGDLPLRPVVPGRRVGWTWVPRRASGRPSLVILAGRGGLRRLGSPAPLGQPQRRLLRHPLRLALWQDAYIFVPERYFLAPRLTTYIVSRDRVGTFFRNTRNYSNYRYSGDRIYSQGVPIDRIQRAVGRCR